MTTTATTQKTTYGSNPATGTVVPFEGINDPGCYICNWSGHLLRVPEDGVARGRSPLINMIGHEALFVTKVSDDPYIPLTKAKMVASNLDCAINF